MTGTAALRVSASRYYWSCVDAIRRAVRAIWWGGARDAVDEPAINATLNVTVTTTLRRDDGQIRRLSFVFPPRVMEDRVEPVELAGLLHLAELARFRDHPSAARRLIRGMSPAGLRRAMEAGIVVPGARQP